MDSASMSLEQQVRKELFECKIDATEQSNPVSEFRYNSISNIDINGQVAKEKSSTGAQKEPLAGAVSFPGIQLTQELSPRPRWHMLRALYRLTHETSSWDDLDSVFTKHTIVTNFIIPNPQEESPVIINHTVALLSRLPCIPLELPRKEPPREDEMKGCWLKLESDEYSWGALPTVQRFPRSVTRMGIAMALTGDRRASADVGLEVHRFRDFLDLVSELIDGTFLELEKFENGKKSTWRWFVLLSYLWTIWQRCLALHYWRVLQDSLEVGFDYTGFGELSLRPNKASFLVLETQQTHPSPYMCTLAYNILRRSRSTFLLDLRQFHKRFEEIMFGKPGRCLNDRPCSGVQLDDCRRIKGANVVNQSQHDILCSSPSQCFRLAWNENSYSAEDTARAVSISRTSHELCYGPADASTLAISHVWSHGQGGRPEKGDGLNLCLHARYCRIAEQLGCSSYWIDTACIPSCHILRRKAIRKINQVFTNSYATLLCDRDIMEIDISDICEANETSPHNVALMESILATVLVCDWNVRAWTLLEALRGRKNIFLLCKSGKNNGLISLKRILRVVAYYGDISLAILLLTNHQLFPPPLPAFWMKLRTNSRNLPRSLKNYFDGSYDGSLTALRISRGFVSVSEAASLLGQRFASRVGDDIIIWSLLVGESRLGNDTRQNEALNIWTRGKSDGTHMDIHVHTGHLVSSVSRLKFVLTSSQGISWAPSQPGPYLMGDDETAPSQSYPPFDGSQSRLGTIEFGKEGIQHLRATWGATTIHFEHDIASYCQSFNPVDGRRIRVAVPYKVKVWLAGYQEGRLLQPLQQEQTEYKRETCASIYGGYKNSSKGLLFVVCGRNDKSNVFTWLGVIDWGSLNLPVFQESEVLLA